MLSSNICLFAILQFFDDIACKSADNIEKLYVARKIEGTRAHDLEDDVQNEIQYLWKSRLAEDRMKWRRFIDEVLAQCHNSYWEW